MPISLSEMERLVQTRSTRRGITQICSWANSGFTPSFSTASWSFSAAYSRSQPPHRWRMPTRPTDSSNGSSPVSSAGPRAQESEVVKGVIWSSSSGSCESTSRPSTWSSPVGSPHGSIRSDEISPGAASLTTFMRHMTSALTVKETTLPCLQADQAPEGRCSMIRVPRLALAPRARAGTTRPSPSRPAPTCTCTARTGSPLGGETASSLVTAASRSWRTWAASRATGSMRTAAMLSPEPISPRDPLAAPERCAW
mmetsp:Transcript_6751/g.22115  ORF Transcript_6751/g.22115 Transcript_6751/m.22115 type:complete len:254 (+) Transcript_6751:1500-2261(+)